MLLPPGAVQVPYTQAERSFYLFSRWLNAVHSNPDSEVL